MAELQSRDRSLTVKVPPDCIAEINKIVRNSVRFDSAEDFVVAVLRELLFPDPDSGEVDDSRIQDRLRDLGYLQ